MTNEMSAPAEVDSVVNISFTHVDSARRPEEAFAMTLLVLAKV